MLNTTILIIALALGIFILAYTFTIFFPLFGIIRGGWKIMKMKALKGEAPVIVNFNRGLGFTMADGGEKKEKKENKK